MFHCSNAQYTLVWKSSLYSLSILGIAWQKEVYTQWTQVNRIHNFHYFLQHFCHWVPQESLPGSALEINTCGNGWKSGKRRSWAAVWPLLGLSGSRRMLASWNGSTEPFWVGTQGLHLLMWPSIVGCPGKVARPWVSQLSSASAIISG